MDHLKPSSRIARIGLLVAVVLAACSCVAASLYFLPPDRFPHVRAGVIPEHTPNGPAGPGGAAWCCAACSHGSTGGCARSGRFALPF